MSAGGTARFVKNVGASLLGSVLNLIVLVWVNQYLLRRIGAEEYSLVPVLTSLMIFGELFRDAFAGGIGRFLVAAEAKDDSAEVSRIVSSMFPLLTVIALVLALAGAFAVIHVDSLIKVDEAYHVDAQIMLALLILSLCLEIFAAPFSLGLFVKMRFVTLNLVNLFSLLCRIALLFALLFGIGPKALWLVVAMVFGGVLDLAIRIYFTWRLLPAARFQRGLIRWETVATLLSFSLWTTVHGLGNIVQRAAPALLLNRYATPVGVVSFHLGNLPDVQIRRLISAGSRPALPELTTIFTSGGKEALRSFFYRGGKYYLWAAMFLVPGLVVFGEPLIILYVGREYLDTAIVLACILGAYPLVWASAMFYQVAYACGEIRAFNVLNMIVVLATLGLLWLFVVSLQMGAIGAGYAFGLGSGLGHLLIIWPGSLRFIGGSWSEFMRKTLLPGCLPTLGAGLIGFVLLQVDPLQSWTRMALAFALVSAVYFVVILTLCLDADDRALLARLRSRLKRNRE